MKKSRHRHLMTNEFDIELQQRLTAHAGLVHSQLESVLDTHLRDGEIARPEMLIQAMRHGALNGGKRIRPALALESAILFDADPEQALHAATALECIHCYSLIHDDLPAMDDDDLRRGKPTVHIAFDEATAILAGDSLLTFAFDILSAEDTGIESQIALTLIRDLARASGMGGMAGGQALDLAAEKQAPDEAGIIRLQAMKTGALLLYGCKVGPILAGRPQEDIDRMTEFGAAIGLAFQIADDLLDLTSDAETMGKATGKDADRGKGTLVSLHGEDWARKQLSGLVAQATELLKPYGRAGRPLTDIAEFIATRKS